MIVGALVSVNEKIPFGEVIKLANDVQTTGGARLVDQRTWNVSLVGADQDNTTLVAVTVMLVMDGSGATKTVKLFVALKGGTPLSVTTVVITFVVPACASTGVHVMTPVFVLITGTFVPVTVLDKA